MTSPRRRSAGRARRAAQRGRVVDGVGLRRQLLHSYGRGVQQLVDDTSHAALDLIAFMIIKMGQPGVQPAQFAGHHLRGHGTQRDDRRGDLGGTAQAKEVGNLFPNEGAGVFDFLGARRIWLFGDEAIQVHQANTVFDDLWCYVGRKGEINDSAHRRTREVLHTNGERPCSCAGHQNIGLRERLGEI